jgi:predicted acyl esterase
MATKIYFVDGTSEMKLARKFNNQAGTPSWWTGRAMQTTAPASASAPTVTSVTGPTGGVEPIGVNSDPEYFLSQPLAAGFTLSGSISINLWGLESNMAANAALALRIDKVSAKDFTLVTVSDSKDDAELGTAAAAMTWTTTPTSTVFAKGDRIRVVVYFDDAAANMASGHTLTFRYGHTVANTAESWFEITENISFGTQSFVKQLFLNNSAGEIVTSDLDLYAGFIRE